MMQGIRQANSQLAQVHARMSKGRGPLKMLVAPGEAASKKQSANFTPPSF